MRLRAASVVLNNEDKETGLFRVFSSEDFEKGVQKVRSVYTGGSVFVRFGFILITAFVIRLAYVTLAHSKGNLIFRPSDGSIFYEYNDKYWYVPTPTSCRNFKLSHATVSTAIRLDSLNTPSIYDMDDFDYHCEPKKKFVPTGPCQGPKCSAVATLYNMIPGGGEKYLLSLVRATQKLGDFVDILILPGNSCDNTECVRRTAESLNVHIDWTQAQVRVVDRNSTHFMAGRHYHIFALLGNDKIPKFAGSGHINLYLNQFPFDRQRMINSRDQVILSTYHYVVLNSEYSKGWYSTYTNQSFSAMQLKGLHTPRPVVINPPVTALAKKAGYMTPELMNAKRDPWIVMTGRFFDDVQGKHHLDAIEAFRMLRKAVTQSDQEKEKEKEKGEGRRKKKQQLRGRERMAEGDPENPADPMELELSTDTLEEETERSLELLESLDDRSNHRRGTAGGKNSGSNTDSSRRSSRYYRGGDRYAIDPEKLQLFLAGYQMPGHEDYTRQVEQAAARVPGVHVLVNIDGDQLARLQARTSVVWSLTGGIGTNDNPADAEHFGIAVVEAMSTGNVPVLTNRGGLQEIVAGNGSHLCSTIKQVAQRTFRILQLSELEQLKLRQWSRDRSEHYGDDMFDNRVTDLLTSPEAFSPRVADYM